MPNPSFTPVRLRCEYLSNPLGIDVLRPRLSWELAAGDPNARELSQRAYRVLVASGERELVENRGDLWDSGRVQSSDTCQVEYAGRALESAQWAYWKVCAWDQNDRASDWSTASHWSMGLLGDGWTRTLPGAGEASWIGPDVGTPWNDREAPAAPMLRRRFELKGEVRRAVAFVTALGLYELRINGRRIGDRCLAPEWTDYRRRLQYQTYDVTDSLRGGENAIGAILGHGWYAGRLGLTHIDPGGNRRGIYGRHLRLLLSLHIDFADGTKQFVRSDREWKYTLDGPIRGSDLLDGETVDARREIPEWDTHAFNDSAWQQVDSHDMGPPLVPQPNEPIRVTTEIRPVAISQPRPGVYVIDVGQQIAGWMRARVRGAAGDEVKFRHVEMLNPDGTIYRDNLRIPPISPLGAHQEDKFICRGTSQQEPFEPRFTYHGFRYVEVTGLNYKPAPDDFVACAVHSDAPVAGQFSCSSDLINRMMSAVSWTLRCNLHGVPTDCPQRDERFGWTGDMQAFAGCAMFQMDLGAFFTKWLRDVTDAQARDGRLPDFAPHPYDPDSRFSGNPGWGEVMITAAWKMYRLHGDRRILEHIYEPTRRYIEQVRATNPNLIWHNRTNRFEYGDWLNTDTLQLEGFPKSGAKMPIDVYSTAFFAHGTELFSRFARVLGRTHDAESYGKLASEIRAAFNKSFVSEDARIEGDTQAGYAMALYFDLLPEALRGRAAKRMADGLKPYRGHLSTGFQSTLPMMLELSRHGFHDEAYALINQTEIPSWGYMVEHGGTTIWERWDGWVEGRGFQNPGMNSFCHYAIGSVGEWVYRVIGGINPGVEDKSGGEAWSSVTIAPVPGGGLTWAKCAYHSIRGKIETEWRIENGTLALHVTIPPNMIASVHLPRPRGASVPAEAPKRIGSGSYTFEVAGWK